MPRNILELYKKAIQAAAVSISEPAENRGDKQLYTLER